MMKKIILLTAVTLLFLVPVAEAIPNLQLYIEGATYDTPSETWIVNSSDFILWVLSEGVYDVKLSGAFPTTETGTITLTPTTATSGLLPAPGDPSTPSVPVLYTAAPQVGTQPVMGDGGLLPSHGIYGSGTSWLGYTLGNMILTDSPIGDYSGSVPSTWPDMGQINAYDVAITGFTQVHFDAFDHTVFANGNIQYVNAPFSHDAQGGGDDGGGGGGGGQVVPEPGTIILLGSGLLGLALYGRMRFRK